MDTLWSLKGLSIMENIDAQSVEKLFARFKRNCPDTQEYNQRLAEEITLIFNYMLCVS